MHKLAEDDFNKLLEAKNYPVKILAFEDGPTNKVRFKSGTQKHVTYKAGMVGDKPHPQADVDKITHSDVYREKEITTRVVNFEFINKEDEQAWLASK